MKTQNIDYREGSVDPKSVGRESAVGEVITPGDKVWVLVDGELMRGRVKRIDSFRTMDSYTETFHIADDSFTCEPSEHFGPNVARYACTLIERLARLALEHPETDPSEIRRLQVVIEACNL